MVDEITPIGVSLADLYGTKIEQPPSYIKGNYSPTHVSDTKLLEILNNASDSTSDDDTQKIYSETFKRLSYDSTVNTDDDVPTAYTGIFEYYFEPITSGVNNYQILINVRWDMTEKNGLSTSDLNIAHTTALQAITDVWGGYSLKSIEHDIEIFINPNILRNTDESYFEISVYPNSATTSDLSPYFEVVRMGGTFSSPSWNMRKTFSFSKFPSDKQCDKRYYDNEMKEVDPQGRMTEKEPFKKGRGVHEFGHMIGLIHDREFDSIMYTRTEDGSFPQTHCWRYRDTTEGGCRPFASHFRLVKLWAEKILKEKFFITTELLIVEPNS